MVDVWPGGGDGDVKGASPLQMVIPDYSAAESMAEGSQREDWRMSRGLVVV